MSAWEQIRVGVEDGIGTITLNRPARLNAYTEQMGVELHTAIAELNAAERVRVIVVTGAGRAFCAGADLDASGATFGSNTWSASKEREDAVAAWTLDTPIIAAINGPAVGVGATLPLSWDLRIASDRARIAFPFTRRGITPEAGSSWILPRLVGVSAAMGLLITGRTIDAHEALRLGIVSRVVPHEEFESTIAFVARDIAVNTAPVSVALTRKLLWRQLMDNDPAAARVREEAVFHWSSAQPDTVEGVKAFMEKRAPSWPSLAPSGVPNHLVSGTGDGD